MCIFSCIDERLMVNSQQPGVSLRPHHRALIFCNFPSKSCMWCAIGKELSIPASCLCSFTHATASIYPPLVPFASEPLHVFAPLSVLESRRFVTPRKIPERYRANFKRSCGILCLYSIALIDACSFPTYEATSCLCHFLERPSLFCTAH